MQERRTLSQNAKFSCMLRDVAGQLQWAGLWWSEDDWRALVLGAKYGQVVAPNPFGHGLLVMNKQRSSTLKKSGENPNMADLINELQSFGDENGVIWSDPKDKAMRAAWERETA